MSTYEDRENDARLDRMLDDQAEQEAAQQRAEDEYLEGRAKADGKPECPICHQRRGVQVGPPVWCLNCDEPAVD